jgi:hypothetical protein
MKKTLEQIAREEETEKNIERYLLKNLKLEINKTEENWYDIELKLNSTVISRVSIRN